MNCKGCRSYVTTAKANIEGVIVVHLNNQLKKITGLSPSFKKKEIYFIEANSQNLNLEGFKK